MQNRRTEVTQTGQTHLSEEPTVPAASVEEASGCLVYRGGRATRTGQAGEWTHPSSVASHSNSEKRSEIQGADESSVTMSGCAEQKRIASHSPTAPALRRAQREEILIIFVEFHAKITIIN